MENKILGWDTKQVVELFKTVNKYKGGEITKAFGEFAKMHKRKPMSVRNFYYQILDKVNTNCAMQIYFESKGVIIPKGDNRRFDKLQERELLFQVLNYSDKKSVRSKCMSLAKGNKAQFIRLQNKYRNLLVSNKQMVLDVCEELKAKGFSVRTLEKGDLPQNVLAMPISKAKPLREEEIQALFWGLVRLVKKNAEEEISQNLAREAEFANTTLQKTLIDVRRKDLLISELREQNQNIRNELSKTKERLATVVTKNLSNFLTLNDLVKSEKMKELRQFIAKLNPSIAATKQKE